jgi:hypothetical protein
MTVHQHETVKVCSGYDNDTSKRELHLQPESLFSMAMYDMDSLGQQQQHPEQKQDLEPLPVNTQFSFYPVDEYKDLSLRELLELSDDYLFAEEDENLIGEEEESNTSNSSMLTPIPLNLPCGHNVDSHDAQDDTEPVVSTHMGNQMQPTMNHMDPTPINEWIVTMIPTFCQSFPMKKKSREEPLDNESDEALNNEGRFRPHQVGQWVERFNDLCLYREKHGNCVVPHTYRADLALARWVKRQRYQYKLMREGMSSTITEERVKALEEIGFVWNSQGAAWDERLEEIKEFRSIYMHCNVPSNYRENPQLAIWVKSQRRQYRLLMEGKASNLTPQRIHDLEAVGFKWLPRSFKKQRII